MKLQWSRAFQIRELLNNVASENTVRPPCSNGVYIVTRKPWLEEPSVLDLPLYFGGNTQNTNRFRTRIGCLIADLMGFYSEGSGHHSGGQSLHQWCQENAINPQDLYIGWATSIESWCARCAENSVATSLTQGNWQGNFNAIGLLNKNRPSACKIHNVAVE
ncbi:hypothetical protein OE987_003603 [Vibrio cholerae]|uniref:hypothetical protein n=1 Tax=Vibrio sp. AH4 TaxID=2919577 RepID=UPI002739881B|nr:hypothetical protein [Vibrio sp. AH4]EJY0884961.1 hypothetical protein [Vibrio cholerae]MDP4494018.1 hypothetical protein [Vibrio sp. AH4]